MEFQIYVFFPLSLYIKTTLFHKISHHNLLASVVDLYLDCYVLTKNTAF